MTTPGDGRNQVVDDAVIDTAWGNAVSDRTIQTYVSAASRDALWPNPSNGAMSYTRDTDENWVGRGGKWKRIPEGYLGQAIGPPTETHIPSGDGTHTEVLRCSFAAKLGRAYQIIGQCNFQLINASALFGVLLADDQGGSIWIDYNAYGQGLDSMAGSATYIYRPTSTKTAWARITAFCSGAGAQIWTGANWEFISVIDIGGA